MGRPWGTRRSGRSSTPGVATCPGTGGSGPLTVTGQSVPVAHHQRRLRVRRNPEGAAAVVVSATPALQLIASG